MAVVVAVAVVDGTCGDSVCRASASALRLLLTAAAKAGTSSGASPPAARFRDVDKGGTDGSDSVPSSSSVAPTHAAVVRVPMPDGRGYTGAPVPA